MIAFILTFPSVGSWNGKFSGEKTLYADVRKLSEEEENKLAGEHFAYRWDDGWLALIECRKVTGAEAAKLRKKSRGFMGYYWMIDSILSKGEIILKTEKHT